MTELRKEIINIIITVVSVIAIMAIAALLFLKSGMTKALLVAFIGVPILFIVISILYVFSVKKRRMDDPAIKVKVNELKNISKRYQDLENKVDLAMDRFNIDVGKEEIDILKHRLVENGCIFQDNGVDFNASVIKTLTLVKIQNMGSDIDDYKKQYYDELLDRIRSDTSLNVDQLGILDEVGYPVKDDLKQLTELSNTELEADFEQIINYLGNVHNILTHAVELSIDSINDAVSVMNESILGNAPIDLEPKILFINNSIDNGKFADILKEFLHINLLISDLAGSEFTDMRDHLIEAIEISMCSDPLCNEDEQQRFYQIAKKIEELVNPSGISTLTDIENDFIQHCRNVIGRIQKDGIHIEKNIRKLAPPQNYWKESEIATKEYAITETHIVEFAKQFCSIINELEQIHEKDKNAYKVLTSYHNVIEKQIKKRISESNTVGLDDIGVLNADEFMYLYSYYHPKVFYHRSLKTLSLKTDAEPEMIAVEKALVFKVTDADTGEGIAAHIVMVRDSGIGVDLDYDIGANGELTIEKPSEGQYTLIASAENYNSMKLEVTNPSDTIEIKMICLPPVDSLCKDKDEAVRRNIKRYSNFVDEALTDTGVATSSLDIRIKEEYRPCFLKIYAEDKTNIHFIKHNKEHLIYDENVIRDRIIDIAKQMDSPPSAEDIAKDIDIPLTEILRIFEIINGSNDLHYKLQI